MIIVTSFSTTIKNDSLLKSNGILLQPDEHIIAKMFGQDKLAKIKKPWIILGKQVKKYSRIDEPLYFLDNGTLWEHYKLKHIRKSNVLGSLYGHKFKWNENMPKNFFDRRGNFEKLTLIGVTETEWTFNQLPFNFDVIANISESIPNTYEVRTLLYN